MTTDSDLVHSVVTMHAAISGLERLEELGYYDNRRMALGGVWDAESVVGCEGLLVFLSESEQ